MRFVRLLAATAALACSGLAGQAQAAKIFSISGTLTPDQYGDASLNYWAGNTAFGPPFSHGVRVSFSAPVTGTLELYTYYTYLVLNKDNQEVDGNELDWYSTSNLTNSLFARANFNSPIRPLGNGLRYVEYTRSVDATVDLSGLSGPVNYRMSGFSAAPEPSTWALLILGFGGIGGALRRRRASDDVRADIIEGTARPVIGG